MPRYKIIGLDPAVEEPLLISAALRNQLNYFVITKSHEDEKRLAPNEFEIDLLDVARWAERGAIRMVSPLDSSHFAEVELSFEQLDFLDWLLAGQIQRLRVEEAVEAE
jgi:hypothetical protein